MSLDVILQQETKGLTDDALLEIIRFVRFMKMEAGNTEKYRNHTPQGEEKKRYRKAGKFFGVSRMPDDFNGPIDDFEEYM